MDLVKKDRITRAAEMIVEYIIANNGEGLRVFDNVLEEIKSDFAGQAFLLAEFRRIRENLLGDHKDMIDAIIFSLLDALIVRSQPRSPLIH